MDPNHEGNRMKIQILRELECGSESRGKMNSDPCARRFMETYLWRTPQLKRTDTEPVGRGLGEEQGEEGGGGEGYEKGPTPWGAMYTNSYK